MRDIKSITIKEFEAQIANRRGGLGVTSWQREAIEAMLPDTALQMSHEGISCKPAGNGKQRSCGFAAMGTSVRLKTGYILRIGHTDNGDVLVARYSAKPETLVAPAAPVVSS